MENYFLQGQMRHRRMSPSVFLCAQLWLKKEENKICELNDEGIDFTQTLVTSLVPKRGFNFGKLLK